MKNYDENNVVDHPYGILTLTFAQIKTELLNRGLSRSSLNQDLVARLIMDFERDDNWGIGINNRFFSVTKVGQSHPI